MAQRFRSLLLFGPPGVGKGTQGTLLGHIPGLFHLATGDMFRSLDARSELGRQFHEYSAKGLLVPDELTIRLWEQYVRQRIADGRFNPASDLLVLDGIPRSARQAVAMDTHLDVLGILHLVCEDQEEMIRRMKGRAEKEGRHDDADEAVIRRRFQVYQAETAPVLRHYDDALVHDIVATGLPIEVLHRILDVVVPVATRQCCNPLA